VLQQDAGNPDRTVRRRHEQQSVVRIGVGFVEVPERRDTGIRNTRQLSAETAKERDPRLAIKHEESEGRATCSPTMKARKMTPTPIGVHEVVPARSPEQDAVARLETERVR